MDTVDLIIKSSTEFYNDLKVDENGRYRSWEHCYSHFIKARGSQEIDYDYLSLQLAFYLASWGMYRGSSFLLQKDYKVHIPVVKELLNEKYDVLAGIDCIGFKDDSNQKLLQDINSFLEQYYDKIRHKVKEQELKNQLSFTLITKILMGTLGCVPAYDRYFIAGIKNQKVATGNYNIRSVMQLVHFYIGKGTKNRVFEHEKESLGSPDSEKLKLKTIADIKNAGFEVEKIIINSNLTEEEAFAAEASLINAFNYVGDAGITNIVAGHHSAEALSVDEYERINGAAPLEEKDIRHKILVIKINRLYQRGMDEKVLSDAVCGVWRVSKEKVRTVEYVFGVYNSLIVAVYKPSEWFVCKEAKDRLPRQDIVLTPKTENRLFFLWMKDMSRDFRWMRMNRSTLESR